MLDRPIAIYRDGGLFRDEGGYYQPITPSSLSLFRWALTGMDDKGHQRRIEDISKALQQYAEAQKEKAHG